MTRDVATQLRMRWIRPGRYLRGSGEDDPEALDREKPQHEVVLTQGFWLSDAPVTQALWVAVMGENPSWFEGAECPVEWVSWEDCQRFCARLGPLYPGLHPRLPTEAEWEYAARAGTTTPRYGALDDVAWYGRNSGAQTHPVRQKLPNPWGLYDMLGNVSEWCQDSSSSYGALGSDGSERVYRGGSWGYGARDVRAAVRDALGPGIRSHDLGFRLAAGSSARPPSGLPDGATASHGGAPPASAPQTFALTHSRPRARGAAMRQDLASQLRMRWIRPGRYLRGSSDDDPEAYDDEKPQHKVVLTQGFWLSDAPVTQAVWSAVMGDNPSRFEGAARPVEQVSWEDCQRFCARLSLQCPGLHPRLPTEAEWECAARVGITTPRYGGVGDVAWYNGNSGQQTHPVRQRQPNPWGLYDMLGNVWEWCQDSSSRDHEPYSADGEPQVNPLRTDGSERVVRGGSWAVSAQLVRATFRAAGEPGLREDDLGFRLAAGRAHWSRAKDGGARRPRDGASYGGLGGVPTTGTESEEPR